MSNEWSSDLHRYGWQPSLNGQRRTNQPAGTGGGQGVSVHACRWCFDRGVVGGASGIGTLYCECTKGQSLKIAGLQQTAGRWFEHPDPITKHERELQYQAYKARLMLELGLGGEK